MSPRGPRRRVARGVYRDALGLAAIVKVDGRQTERRFPAGTDLGTIAAWQRTARARRALQLEEPARAPTTTLAGVASRRRRGPNVQPSPAGPRGPL